MTQDPRHGAPRRSRSTLALLFLCGACGSTPAVPDQPAVYFPAPPDPPRIQFLRSVDAVTDVVPKASSLDSLLFGESAEDRRRLGRPFGCALHAGIVYVADAGLGAVVRIDLAQRKIDLAPVAGRASLMMPLNLCFSPDGTLYVADAGRRQVVALTESFEWAGEFGPFGEESKPIAVATWRDRLYVVDIQATCVRVLDRTSGEELMQLGSVANDVDWLRLPQSVAVDRDGYVYVADGVFCKVFVWDKDGKFVRFIGEQGQWAGALARPKGIAVSDEDNTIWVTDVAFSNCQIFAKNGQPLMFFGNPGPEPGNLYMPAGVWIGTDGLELFTAELDKDFVAERLIVVTSQYGPRKVSFFAFGRSKKFEYQEVALPSVPTPQQTTGEATAGGDAGSPPPSTAPPEQGPIGPSRGDQGKGPVK